MKRLAIAMLSIALVAILFGSPATTHAAEGAYCWADSYELAQGDSTGVYCSGFSPLTWLNVYYAEPDGTAAIYGDVKSDANGNVTFGWGNGATGGFGYSFSLGTYTIVVQELGLAKEIKIVGKVDIKNSGAGGHVSGAYLTASPSPLDRTSESVTLTGWGFTPGEIVTLWIQTPAVCSSFTGHYVDGKNGSILFNFPVFDDISTQGFADAKADSSGAFSLSFSFNPVACEGTWRLAGRGNTSGLGAYADIVVTGPHVSTNAWLIPSKDSVGALFDTIEFYAYGFGANETLNCWTTSPEGRAVPYGIPFSFDKISVGPDGSGVFALTTGSYYLSEGHPFAPGGVQIPIMSEGSLGVWKMSCNGLASGTTAIAEYTVHGYETAP